MKFLFPFLFFSISIISFQCKKSNPNSDNGLPPATQTGQNIFACKMNGLPWISRKGRPAMGGDINGDTTLAIGGSVLFNSGDQERLGIVINGIYRYSQTTYVLNDTLTAYGVYEKSPGKDCFSQVSIGYGGWVVKKVAGGFLNITKVDTLKKIIAGTFNFHVITDFCDTLKLTDGRFDIKYQ
jgi:hypothetical protein